MKRYRYNERSLYVPFDSVKLERGRGEGHSLLSVFAISAGEPALTVLETGSLTFVGRIARRSG